jgi:hypothetical protein
VFFHFAKYVIGRIAVLNLRDSSISSWPLLSGQSKGSQKSEQSSWNATSSSAKLRETLEGFLRRTGARFDRKGFQLRLRSALSKNGVGAVDHGKARGRMIEASPNQRKTTWTLFGLHTQGLTWISEESGLIHLYW